MEPIFAYAQINARIMPVQRGEWFEDPLQEAFEKNGFGEVTGGGTMQSKEGETDYCGIDINLTDIPKGVPFVCEFLTRNGAPRGSKLQYKQDGNDVEVPFGDVEALAVYLNGTDLPGDVYKNNDVNDVVAELQRLLGRSGSMAGHWQGPRETALYFHGRSADEMRDLISGYLAEHPLCQKSRVVVIA